MKSRTRPAKLLTMSPEAWARLDLIASRAGLSRSAMVETLVRGAEMRYLANVDVDPDKRGARPATEEIRSLVAQGLAVTLSAPYPYAASHTHLTPAGQAAYEAQVCGACGHEPADEWLASGGVTLPCPRCGSPNLGGATRQQRLCLTCGEPLTGIAKGRGHGAGDCRAVFDRLRSEVVALRRERDDARYSRDAAEEELSKYMKMGRHDG